MLNSSHTNSQWDMVKQALKAQLPTQEYSTWLAPLQSQRTGPRAITILLPNLVFYQKMHDAYLPLIERAKSDLGIEDVSFQFELEGAADERNTCDQVDGAAFDKDPGELPIVQSAPIPNVGFSRSISTENHLNTMFTFETFVRGASNQFAMTTCHAVSMRPGQFYNPLFICGSTGLGKTHLLHAVGNEVLKNNPDAVVTYVTSERFMNELVYCLRFKKMIEFRQKYRLCDVILIDDIQFMSGKKATQEEFFHTFNALYDAKKQIVLTSDILPQGIPDIEDRLKNRFQWGLIADIQVPDYEHRVAILMKKAEQMQIKLDVKIAEYIAKHCKRNVRELEGSLSRLFAFADFHGEPVSLDLAIRSFRDIYAAEAPKQLTVDTVQRVVADHFKLKVADLKSKKKHSAVAYPRQIAMYLARRMTSASLPELGSKFGGKDHTTVLHNVKKIEHAVLENLDLKAIVDTLQRQIEQMH